MAKPVDQVEILRPPESVPEIQARYAAKRGKSLRDQILALTRGGGRESEAPSSSPVASSRPSPVTPLPPTRPRDPPSLPLTPRPASPSVPRRAASRVLVALPRG